MNTPFLIILSMLSFNAVASPFVHISSGLQERAQGSTDLQIICVGDQQDWAAKDFNVASRISRLQMDHPGIFHDQSDTEKNCFSPTSVPKKSIKNLDLLLGLIDQSAKDRMVISITVPEDIVFEDQKSPIDLSLKSLRNEDSTLLKKLIRAELIVLPGQVLTMTALALMPSEWTNWEKGWIAQAPQHLERAWSTAPVLDKDNWFTNLVAHPYSGHFYYNALRSQGATRLQSFLFSAFQSTVTWEYVIEATAEQPSLQDIVFTPIIGSFIGELSHMATMHMRKNGFSMSEKILVTVINPAYILNNGLETHDKP